MSSDQIRHLLMHYQAYYSVVLSRVWKRTLQKQVKYAKSKLSMRRKLVNHSLLSVAGWKIPPKSAQNHGRANVSKARSTHHSLALKVTFKWYDYRIWKALPHSLLPLYSQCWLSEGGCPPPPQDFGPLKFCPKTVFINWRTAALNDSHKNWKSYMHGFKMLDYACQKSLLLSFPVNLSKTELSNINSID